MCQAANVLSFLIHWGGHFLLNPSFVSLLLLMSFPSLYSSFSSSSSSSLTNQATPPWQPSVRVKHPQMVPSRASGSLTTRSSVQVCFWLLFFFSSIEFLEGFFSAVGAQRSCQCCSEELSLKSLECLCFRKVKGTERSHSVCLGEQEVNTGGEQILMTWQGNHRPACSGVFTPELHNRGPRIHTHPHRHVPLIHDHHCPHPHTAGPRWHSQSSGGEKQRTLFESGGNI